MTIRAVDPAIGELPRRPAFRTTGRTLIEARIRSPFGRAHLAGSMREMACEAFDLGGGESTHEPMPHLVEALDRAIETATDAAIDAFLAALDDLLRAVDEVDPRVWDEARRRAQLGTE